MGKKVSNIEKIEQKRKRTVVKNKRRNGLLKKAVELTMLCGQKIYLVIYDPEYDRMIQFLSDPLFDIEKVYSKIQALKNLKTKLSLRTYTNEDFYQQTTKAGSEGGCEGEEDSLDSAPVDHRKQAQPLGELEKRYQLQRKPSPGEGSHCSRQSRSYLKKRERKAEEDRGSATGSFRQKACNNNELTFQNNNDPEEENLRITNNILKLQQELRALENQDRLAGLSEMNINGSQNRSFYKPEGSNLDCQTQLSNFAQENYFVMDQFNDRQNFGLGNLEQPTKKRRSRFEEENNFRKDQELRKDIQSTEMDSRRLTVCIDTGNRSITSQFGSLGFLPSRGNVTVMMNSSVSNSHNLSQSLSKSQASQNLSFNRSLFSNQPNLTNLNGSDLVENQSFAGSVNFFPLAAPDTSKPAAQQSPQSPGFGSQKRKEYLRISSNPSAQLQIQQQRKLKEHLKKRKSDEEMMVPFATQQQRDTRSLHRGMRSYEDVGGVGLFMNQDEEKLELKRAPAGETNLEMKPEGDELYNNIANNKKFTLPTVESLPQSNSVQPAQPLEQVQKPELGLRRDASSSKREASKGARERRPQSSQFLREEPKQSSTKQQIQLPLNLATQQSSSLMVTVKLEDAGGDSSSAQTFQVPRELLQPVTQSSQNTLQLPSQQLSLNELPQAPAEKSRRKRSGSSRKGGSRTHSVSEDNLQQYSADINSQSVSYSKFRPSQKDLIKWRPSKRHISLPSDDEQ